MFDINCTISAASMSSSCPPWRIEFSTIEVPMWPGITTDTFTCGALTRRSVISASLNPFTANFAAE